VARGRRDRRDPYLVLILATVLLAVLASAGLVLAALLIQRDLGVVADLVGVLAAAVGVLFVLVWLYCVLDDRFSAAWLGGDQDALAAPAFAPAEPEVIAVSPLARRYIRSRGGEAYVWLAEFTDEFVQLRAATGLPPGEVAFLQRQVGGLDVFVAPDVRVPRLMLRLALLPRPHLVAYWPGGFVTTG
jgi:hypothetical protein